jgi:hypothetical protein
LIETELRMTDTETLMAILEIQALKARYFRAMDTKDWAGLEAVFAPDLEADFRQAAGQVDESMLIHGAAAYVASLAPILQDVSTVHHGHMPEIQVHSPTMASGVWAMEDKLWVSEGSPLPFRFMHGYGHYHETYVRLADGWRIKTIRLTRLRIDAG